MRNGPNPEHFLQVSVDLLWNSVPFLVRLPKPRFLSHPYFKMLGCRSRADVATWPRCDVETSRRGDVATWRRRDVETSRRGDTSMFYSSLLQKLLSSLLCSLHRTCIQNKHQIRNLNTKNYIINIKSTWK